MDDKRKIQEENEKLAEQQRQQINEQPKLDQNSVDNNSNNISPFEVVKKRIKNIINKLNMNNSNEQIIGNVLYECTKPEATASNMLEMLDFVAQQNCPDNIIKELGEIYEDIKEIIKAEQNKVPETVGQIKTNESIEQNQQQEKGYARVRKPMNLNNKAKNNKGIFVILLFSVIITIILILYLIIFK